MSLGNLSSCEYDYYNLLRFAAFSLPFELQAIISACRRTRFFVTLINKSLTVMRDRFLVLWEFIDGNDGGCCCGLSQDSVLENSLCSDYVRVLAQKALLSLKSIPVAARRSLPVLVNPEGQVISIPLYFQQLPVFEVAYMDSLDDFAKKYKYTGIYDSSTVYDEVNKYLNSMKKFHNDGIGERVMNQVKANNRKEQKIGGFDSEMEHHNVINIMRLLQDDDMEEIQVANMVGLQTVRELEDEFVKKFCMTILKLQEIVNDYDQNKKKKKKKKKKLCIQRADKEIRHLYSGSKNPSSYAQHRDNYVPWSSRLLRYAKNKSNGKLIYDSIMKGPYMEADDQAIQTILLGLPLESIYANVRGNGGNQFGQYIAENVRNQNGSGNVVPARAEGTGYGYNDNLIRCYNCKGLGHYARNCTVRPRRRDAAYLQTQLLIAQKEEAKIQLQAEEYDLMYVAADIDEIEEVNANCILMANLQQASTSGTQTDKAPIYDSDGSAEVHCDNGYNNDDICNMFTQEDQYYELREPIPESHLVQQNDSDVITAAPSVEQSGG
ncbi:hypothetical protein Tco_0206872 [Tanacetum coccineum]